MIRPNAKLKTTQPGPVAFWHTAGRWLFAAALLASMLLAHGCHGDEDHELFTAFVQETTPQ